jgi:ketosteroid isomerase-like protein
MSRENVELVRRAIELWKLGDVDGALEEAADDVVVDMSNAIGPDKGVYRGRERVHELWASFHDAADAIRWEPEEIIEVDEERLIVVGNVRMRGRGSGVEVKAVSAWLWTISDGKGRSVKLYQSKAEALKSRRAAGVGVASFAARV